jgi:hypothetical protein
MIGSQPSEIFQVKEAGKGEYEIWYVIYDI